MNRTDPALRTMLLAQALGAAGTMGLVAVLVLFLTRDSGAGVGRFPAVRILLPLLGFAPRAGAEHPPVRRIAPPGGADPSSGSKHRPRTGASAVQDRPVNAIETLIAAFRSGPRLRRPAAAG